MADKLALIVGASRGLGTAIAEALAPTHHVLAVARTTGALEELDDRIRSRGCRATLAPLDITDEEAIGRLCQSVRDRWGGLNLWCHTAIHAAPLSPAGHMDDREFDRSISVNVIAVQRLIAWIGPLLLTRPKAQAIFFDDPRAGERFFGAYGASKAAQIALAVAIPVLTATYPYRGGGIEPDFAALLLVAALFVAFAFAGYRRHGIQTEKLLAGS